MGDAPELSVFWCGESCARDFQISGQCSGERNHDRKAHEKQPGNQQVALGKIPQDEQEGAESQHAGANADGPAKSAKENPFQTRCGGIGFTGKPALGAAHSGRSWLTAVGTGNVVRVGFHTGPAILEGRFLSVPLFAV